MAEEQKDWELHPNNYLTDEEVKQDDDFCDDCFYSCCGDELDQDIRICPTCKEHN